VVASIFSSFDFQTRWRRRRFTLKTVTMSGAKVSKPGTHTKTALAEKARQKKVHEEQLDKAVAIHDGWQEVVALYSPWYAPCKICQRGAKGLTIARTFRSSFSCRAPAYLPPCMTWHDNCVLHAAATSPANPQLTDVLPTLLLARSLAVDDGGAVLRLAAPHWSASSPASRRLCVTLCTDGYNQPASPRSAAHHDVMSPTAE